MDVVPLPTPGQKSLAPFRLLMAGALLSGLLWIGSPATVRAEGGDQGEGSCTNSNPTTAGLSGTGAISNGSFDLSAGGTALLKVSAGTIATNGDYRVQFNHVSITTLNGAVFNATSLFALTSCTIVENFVSYPAFKFRALGTLTGPSVAACTVSPGYSIRVFAFDRGEPGSRDSLQLQLFCGPFDTSAVPVYSSLGDFPPPTSDADQGSNKLKSGNYQIQNRP